MAERRRLPVIQPSPTKPRDDEPPPRPPWHWVGFGTIATFACWLPLAYVAQALQNKAFVARFGVAPSRQDVEVAIAAMAPLERLRWTAIEVLPHVGAFALSAFVGGWLVGRFGQNAGPREAAGSGVLTALVALGLSWRVVLEGGWGAAAAVVLPTVIGGFGAWLGGRVGKQRRTRADSKADSG